MHYRIVVKESTGKTWHSIVSETNEGETVEDVQNTLTKGMETARKSGSSFFMCCPPDQIVAFNANHIVLWYVEVYRK